MQLEGNVFAMAVIQLKPALEKVRASQSLREIWTILPPQWP